MKHIVLVLAAMSQLWPAESLSCNISLPLSHVSVTSENPLFTMRTLQTRRCQANTVSGWCPNFGDLKPVVVIGFDTPVLVRNLRFRRTAFDCSNMVEDVPHMTHFNLTYTDSLDPDKQEKAYPSILHAVGNCGADLVCDTNLPSETFTDRITITPTAYYRQPCFSLEVIGCQYTATNIEVDDMSFLSLSNNTLVTGWGNFHVEGNFSLSANTRRSHHHGQVGHFWGHGGCLHHHGPHGHHDSHHHTDHHHSVHHHTFGYCTTVHAAFGHGHDHKTPFFLHTGSDSSLLYSNGTLRYHVTNGKYDWLVTCPLLKPYSSRHLIRTSWHPQMGVSIYVNQKHCNSKVRTPAKSGISNTSLCIGHCNVQSGKCNVKLVNMMGFASSIPYILASLGGFQGLFSNGPSATTARTTRATTTPTTTTTTAAPVSATTTLVTQPFQAPSTNGPVCYDCPKSATDGSCKNHKRCKRGEVCSVFQDPTGFTHKCIDDSLCQLSKNLVSSTCFQCCHTYLCNKQCSVPCTDDPSCKVLTTVGYDVCSDVRVAHTVCNKTCHTC